MSWRTAPQSQRLAPGLAGFLDTIHRHQDFFDAHSPLFVGRAPGRLDVMGGVADYSGALVLQLPLAVAACAAVQQQAKSVISMRSLQAAGFGGSAEVTVPLAELAPGGRPIGFEEARALLGSDPASRWAAYIAGVLLVVAHAHSLRLERGLRVLLDSTVPPGGGVSSSAAIEVATLQAVAALYDVALTGPELATLCQRAENLVVGAPCGIMDQMTAACGEADRLLALLCQPAELQPTVALPRDLEVWGIDSGIGHDVSGTAYTSVRVGAFMGYRIIAECARLEIVPLTDCPGRVRIRDPHWHGYLASIPPLEWEQRFRAAVPESLSGIEFLARYGGTTDAVTTVDPARLYRVRQPTAHPIHEHQRVRLFRALLESLASPGGTDAPADRDAVVAYNMQLEERAALLGQLLELSHASYGACGLGSTGTDRLVELVREAGPERGLFGARITGGGNGGVVAVLGRRGAGETVDAIAERYRLESGVGGAVLRGSSAGAMATGVLRLEPER